MSIYNLNVKKIDGTEFPLSKNTGKVMIIVNTATGCGFTPQYKELEKMYEKFHDKGLEIIDIPCNQFAGQAPESDEEIHNFCTLKYHTQFTQFKKSDVNGENELPLYTYLKKQKGFEGFGTGAKAFAMNIMLKKIDKDYKNNSNIKWNFTKFVVDRNGQVVARFEPTTPMKELYALVENLL